MTPDPAPEPTDRPEPDPGPGAPGAASGPGPTDTGRGTGAPTPGGTGHGEDAPVPEDGKDGDGTSGGKGAKGGVSGSEGGTGRGSGRTDGGSGGAAGDGDTANRDGNAAGGDGGQERPEVSEAEAELAAQRVERERIEQRKAAKQGPVASGGKLSGKAADLLAAVRAVESGEKAPASVFGAPPAPRRTTPEPPRRPSPQTPPRATPAAPAPAPESVAAVRAVLAEGGAPEGLAAQAAGALGEGAAAELRSDPWRLLRVSGVRPEQADAFARVLLGPECRPDDERRGRALAVRVLEQAALAGHTALETAELTASLGRHGVPDPEAAVHAVIAEGDVLVFQDALDEPGTGPAAAPTGPHEGGEDADEEAERPVRVLVGLERYALAEESLADGLARLVSSTPTEPPGAVTGTGTEDASEAWERAAASLSGTPGLSGAAPELVRAVAGHGLVLHTGGEAARAEPAALVAAARSLGLRAYAAAYTSDGGRRLTGAFAASEEDAAVTVTGLLSGAQGPGRDAEGALELDLLAVLDAPQLDVETAATLVEALPDGARLVLSGDPGVLGSAGPGRVFGDLLAARTCPQIASRLPDPGPIGELVSGIGIGELTSVDAPGHEVAVVPVRDPGEATHRAVQLVADSVPRTFGVTADQVQVITPGHGGAVGTRALNTVLKERLNPGPGRFGGFDPGDRIAYIPAPGRTVPGRVVRGDDEGLHLECAGTPVVVPPDQVARTVRHGWALTAHQAAGQRWPAVVVVIPGDADRLLTRPWVLTAFSRAERHLSVVQGVGQALARAVAEVPAPPRTTRLPALLRAQTTTATD